LINYTGNMHELPAYRVEYVAPLAPMTATIEMPTGKRVIGVTRMVAEDSLPYECEGSRLLLTIEGLGVHEVVLVHLAGED
jgi:hypothetical protein